MRRLATLASIGAIALFVFTAIAAAFTGLGRHPRIATVLLLVGPVILVVALLFIEWKPRKRRRR
jgi:hypothetical protein